MRPNDLPQPVRKHESNFRATPQERWRAEASPGPARYSGYGVTQFEKETKLGTFGKDERFKKGQLFPGDSFSTAERASFVEGSGPKYTPKFMDTRLGTSFTSTSHLSHEKRSSTPGPGAYSPDTAWDRGVTFPTSYRKTFSAENTPGPGAYTPSKAPARTRAAHISGASSPLNASNASNRSVCRSPVASLEAMDKSLQITRSSGPAVGFGKAKRRIILDVRDQTVVGPGAYNVDAANTVTQRSVKGGKFGSSKRMPFAKPDTDGRLVSLPPSSVVSTHPSTPSISFTRSAPKRGVPLESDISAVPTAKYTPIYRAVDPSPKVVGWGRPRPGGGRSALVPTVTSNSDFIDAKSTFNTTGISFTEAKRPDSASAPTPGPGAYEPTLKAPKKEPRSVGFPKAARTLVTGVETEKTPGPIYNPDVSSTRPPVAPEIQMPRTDRKTKIAVSTEAPDALYDPKYAQVDKNQRAAILYLTE